MRIVMMNPRLRCAVRRRHSTVLVIEEFGHQIELVFTSLKSLDSFGEHTAAAVDRLLEGKPGEEYWNPSVRDRRPESSELDSLHREDWLETPEFSRRRAVVVRTKPKMDGM